jgi:two-component system sensor kinase FixL
MRQFVEKRDPVRRLLPLNPLIDDAIDLTLLGSRPGTRIARDLADDLPSVMVDPVQIQQVVVNLARNAIEAVKDYSAADIRVATMRTDDKVVLSIQDNGPGIDPIAVPDLFKAFSSSKGTGMGLGLAISRTIAQNHGGDLVVEPGGDGRGACFKLQLPIPAPTDG